MRNENILYENGFIEIDYEELLGTQVDVGDELISTEMYLFDSYGETVELNIDEFNFRNKMSSFIILGVRRNSICFSNSDIDKEDSWFEPTGRIFVKKNSINYVPMLIPDFMVDKVKRSGAIDMKSIH